MNPTFPIIVSAALLGMSACTPTHTTALDNPPGQYEKTTTSTSSNGTDVQHKTSETVGYDANGNKQAVVKDKTTVDPPGLFNKSTSTTTTVEK